MKKLFILLFSLSLLLIAPSTFAQTGSGCCQWSYRPPASSGAVNECRRLDPGLISDCIEIINDIKERYGNDIDLTYNFRADLSHTRYECDGGSCVAVTSENESDDKDTTAGDEGKEGDETPVLGTTNQKPASGSSNTPSVAQAVSLRNPIAADTPQELIGSIINYVLGIIGPLALLMFVVGGLTWMTSAGNPDRIKKGQSILIWSAIGLVVVLFAYGLVRVLFELAAK